MSGLEPRFAKGGVVYVVDDEPMLLELVRSVVESLGHPVETFCDPAEALEAYHREKHKPELIITDYSMRPLNGIELMAACRRIHAGQKVMLLTGTVGPEITESPVARPDYYLQKPCTVRQLAEVVSELLKEPADLKIAS